MLRWLAETLGAVVLAIAVVAIGGYVAIVWWDSAHPPVLPGLGKGPLVLPSGRHGHPPGVAK